MKITHPASPVVLDVDPQAVAQYESQGWRAATPNAPKGNARLEEWQAFAREQGFTEDEISGKTRSELRAALS